MFSKWAASSRIIATALISILAACSPTAETPSGFMICEHYDDSPIPPGYDENGCWFPTEYMDQPPEVIPNVDGVAPVLRIDATGDAPIGIEGTMFFVRAVSPSGRVVLERDWEWPGMEQQVPPGIYQVTAYARVCAGNCERLDPPMMSCTADILLEPSFTYTMTYHVNATGGQLRRCTRCIVTG